MKQIFGQLFDDRGRRDDQSPAVSRDGDSLLIDCRGCGFVPQPESREYIRCMTFAMAEAGGSDRVVLRTGRDVEAE